MKIMTMKLMNIVISLGSALAALAVSYVAVLNNVEPFAYALIIITTVTSAFLFIFASNKKVSGMFYLTAAPLVVGLYIFEFYVEYNAENRSRLAVISNLRAKGESVFTTIEPVQYLSQLPAPVVNGEKLLPVGGIPRENSVICNESGKWVRETYDRFGYNNEDALWDKPVDAVLIGDSFAHGYCVSRQNTIGGQMNSVGVSTLSLGSGGNGPLLEAAALKEYGGQTGAKVVVWLFFPNDYDDLGTEISFPALKEYLKPEFSQHLVAKHQALVSALRVIHEQALSHFDNTASPAGILALRRTRQMFGLQIVRKIRPFGLPENTEAVYRQIMRNVLDQTKTNNTRLLFVYLPSGSELDIKNPGADLVYVTVMKTVRDMGIETVDMRAEFLKAGTLRQWFLCRDCHNSEAGYALIARLVAAKVREMITQ